MKKTLLIASVVAMAMGAQAQNYEWNNPFEEYGAFNCIQKQNDGELGKWFLSCYSQNLYPTIGSYNDTAKVELNDYYDFAIILDISDVFPNKNENNEINIKFKINHNTTISNSIFNLIINSYKENKNLVENFNQLYLDKDNTFRKVDDAKVKIENGQYYLCEKIKIEENENFISIAIKYKGISFYLSDVEITGTNGLDKTNKKYKEYFKYQYFHETYLFSELENKNQELTTSINNNDMVSNIYVSNGVLYTNTPSSVSIFNASGILVKTEHNTDEVDLSDLKKGVYIAKVNGAPIRFVR